MGAIGDYVHYSAIGYSLYGENYPKGGARQTLQDAAMAINKQHQKNNQKIRSGTYLTQAEREDLEQRLTLLMKGSNENGDTIQKQVLEEMWRFLREQLEKDFGALPDTIIRETGNVTREGRIDKIKDLKLQKYEFRLDRKVRNVLVSTVAKYIQNIQTYERELERLNKEGILNKNYLKDKLDAIFTLFEDAVRELNTQIYRDKDNYFAGYTKNVKIGLFGYNNTTKTVIESDKQIGYSLMQQINKAIALINGSENMQKGMLWQGIIALAPYVGLNVAKEGLRDVVKNAYVKNKSKVTFQPGTFFDKFDIKKNLGYELNDNVYVASVASPDKIDCTINLYDKTIPISAKNLNMTGDTHDPYIKLLEKASLLALMSSMDSSFVNHYLNLVSKHDGTEEIYKNSFWTKSYNYARYVMKLSLLTSAFMGYKQNAGFASVFVVNDNQTGKAKVYNIGELIQRGMESSQEFLKTVLIYNLNDSQDIENFHFNNVFKPSDKGLNSNSAFLRIADLLKEVHQIQIAVKFKKSALMEFYSQS